MPAEPPKDAHRIAKLLARAGVASRREIERMIAEGRVALDGRTIDSPATTLASLAGVTVDGNPVAEAAAARLFLYHKPVGLLVTERDPRGRPTIYDRLPPGLPRVVPVGRLDLATEGLLLLTTDGGLKRQLELPATGVERTYRARAYGQVTQAQLEDLIDGVEVEGVRYGRIDANLERRTGANVWIELTLTEGKNREVRRVLEHLGLKVGRLIRTRYGPFVLGDLPAGAVGEIRAHDVESFRAHPTRVDLPQPSRRALSEQPDVMLAPKRDRSPAPRSRGETGGVIEDRSERILNDRPPNEAKVVLPRRREPSLDQRRVERASRAQGSSGGRSDPTLLRGDTSEAAKPQRAARAARAAAHRQATGRAEPPATPRPAKPVRKAGWAKPKPKPGPGRKPGPRKK